MGYSSKMTNQAFWFQESKKSADYMLKGLTIDEISEIAINENIFQVNTPKRASKISRDIYRRLEIFSEETLNYFLKVNVTSAKIFVLVSIMGTDQLFFEFMNEIFKHQIILGKNHLEKKDILKFLENKQLESEKVANWTDNIIDRLSSRYRNMLSEAGVYDLKNNEILIPYIDPYLVQLLKNDGFSSYLETIEI